MSELNWKRSEQTAQEMLRQAKDLLQHFDERAEALGLSDQEKRKAFHMALRGVSSADQTLAFYRDRHLKDPPSCLNWSPPWSP